MSDDGSRFTYSLLWQERDAAGAWRDYATTVWFDTPVQGRRAHEAACGGGWVRPGFMEPHVSALRVWKAGRLLAEELKVKADWCGDHEKLACRCQPARQRAS
jgi:hypothetical protein